MKTFCQRFLTKDATLVLIIVRMLAILISVISFISDSDVMAEDNTSQGNHHSVVKRGKLEVQDDQVAHVLMIKIGPIHLSPHADHDNREHSPVVGLPISFNGWFVSYDIDIVDSDGNPLPSHFLHHVDFWNISRSNLLCPKWEEWMFSAGPETKNWPEIPGAGYRVSKGELIRIRPMFHNSGSVSAPEAFLRVHIAYQLLEDNSRRQSVYPAWFSVRECGPTLYDLQPGRSVNSGKFIIQYSGTLLGVGGHMHDYGRNLRLENLTTREEIVSLDPVQSDSGQIISMPIVMLGNGGGYKVKSGDIIQVTATYEYGAGEPLLNGAMGIILGYFLPDNDDELAVLKRDPMSLPKSFQR